MPILYLSDDDDTISLTPTSTVTLSPFSSQINTDSEIVIKRSTPLFSETRLGTIVPTVIYPTVAALEVDREHHNNYFTQKQMTEWLRYRFLDKWLYDEEYSDLLKYLKLENGKVVFVKSSQEMEDNDIENDSERDIEAKIDFIEDTYLTVNEMRKLLSRIIGELGYRWYNLASHEKIIMKSVNKHLRKMFRHAVTG
jgi:hypothetical protein